MINDLKLLKLMDSCHEELNLYGFQVPILIEVVGHSLPQLIV